MRTRSPSRRGGGPAGRAGGPARERTEAPGRVGARPVWERVLRFLAAVSALCAVASFPASAWFDLRAVDVRGNTVVPTAEILHRAGISPGDSAFRVNAFQIRERLRAHPLIEDAWASPAFPGGLTVSVRERTPVAALQVGEGYVLLGRDAVAINRTSGPGPYLPLRVDRLAAQWVQPGTAVPSADVRLGADLAGSLPASLRPEVAGLRVDAGGEVVLQTRDGMAVQVGGAEGLQDRLAQVPDVLASLRSRGMRVQSVDLRFPGSVIVRPAGASGNVSAPLPARASGVP